MKSLITIIAFIVTASVAKSQNIPTVKIDDVVKMIDTSTTPLVINFWASWCKPCVHEIPWFEKNVALYKHHHVKLVLVSLDFDEDYAQKNLHRFVKKMGYASTILWLNETNADKFCPPIDSSWGGSIPATLMVNNKTGYRQFFPYQLREERFIMELDKLVK